MATPSGSAAWARTPPRCRSIPSSPSIRGPISTISGWSVSTPNILFVRKDFPASTLKEYIAYAKAKGKDLKLGHSGIGSAPHITIVLLSQLIGVEPTMVSYRGFGQTINDILSGTIDGSCDLVAAVSGHVQGGSVKALGGRRRRALAGCSRRADGQRGRLA